MARATPTKEDREFGTQAVPGFECPDCGVTLKSPAAFGGHRRQVHLGPSTTDGRSVVFPLSTEQKRRLRDDERKADVLAELDARAARALSGQSRRVSDAAQAPSATSGSAHPVQRPREHRATSRRRARSPGADDGDSSEPPLGRPCAGCGSPLPAGNRPNKRYCDDCGSNAGRQRRFKAQARAAAVPDTVLVRYRDEVARARRRSILTPEEAFGLLLEPSPRVLALLAEEAA